MFTRDVTPKPPEGTLPENFVVEKYLSCDVARFGHDKTVIKLWYGLQVKKVWTLLKKSTSEVAAQLEKICKEENIGHSSVVVDEDGVGGGVVDQLSGCRGFHNGASPIQPREAERNPEKKVNYQNLKTQCYFKLAEYIAAGKIGIDEIPESMRTEISEELQVIKRENADKDGKLQINSKEKQKELLGRSPDYADCLMMRMYFELKPKKKFFFVQVER